MNIVIKIWNRLLNDIPWLLYMPWTIYFNFRSLPLKDAIKLPIWLYKPHFGRLTGSISIMGGVKTGMIRLGKKCVFIYPGRGISINNMGKIVFNGPAFIGSDSYLNVGKNGVLSIGKYFGATVACSIVAFYSVTIEDNVLIGWDVKIVDTDCHQLQSENGSNPIPYGSITIGEGNWISNSSSVMKNTTIPKNCVLASHSVANKKYDCPEHTLLAGIPAKPVKSGVWRDPQKDKFEYIK